MKGGSIVVKRLVSLLLMISIVPTWCQERIQSGEYRGFAKSPSEGIISRIEQPFLVQKVEGLILRSVGDRSPLDDVVLEIRGPGKSLMIRSVRTGTDGRFSLKDVQSGKYTFKATANGFQSLVGVIIVSPRASSDHPIRLEMKPGA